jgi:hypothetical protein
MLEAPLLGEKMPLLLERALFVVAPQDSGKSTALRSMFLDRRLGTQGVPPPSSTQRNLPNEYHLSNERRLYLRLTSPHEYNETAKEFLQKTKNCMVNGRWSYAGPFQPNAFKKMPDVVKSVGAFVKTFAPERVRVAFLSPNRHGQEIGAFVPGRDLTKELLLIPGVEVMCLDGRQRGKNGLLLADFFDFT